MKGNWLVLCSLLLFVLYTPLAKAQTIQNSELLLKAYHAIHNIKSVVYKVEYSTKYLARKDTIFSTAICSLLIVPKDKLKTYHIIDVEHIEDGNTTYGIRKYNGKKSLWINYPADSLHLVRKPLIEQSKKVIKSIVMNYSDLLLREYFMQKNPFKEFQPVSDRLLVTEDLLKNEAVYVITIAYRDQEDVKDNIEKHYIRKSDFLPIAFYSSLRFENMEQYNYYEVTYLEINPKLSLDVFSVDESNSINAKKRHLEFKKKIE